MTDLSEYLSDFRQRHADSDVLEWLERIHALRPLIVGESIIDRYQFGDVVGKASKDPTLAILLRRTETFAGGSLAVANHLAGLCAQVSLVSQLGEVERQEEFVRSALRPNVNAALSTKRGAPTICKTRTVDDYTGVKLLENYVLDDRPSSWSEVGQLNADIAALIPDCDLVLAADFGHGLITREVADRLWSYDHFLAVNSQSNASSRGYNPVSKYRRADYVAINRDEVNLETHQLYGDDHEKLLQVAQTIACPTFNMTRGKMGCLVYDMRAGWLEAPALATKVVDRVGAGDALFAVTALLARVCAPLDVLAFIGNAAGACIVGVLGNKVPLTRDALAEHIQALMKE